MRCIALHLFIFKNTMNVMGNTSSRNAVYDKYYHTLNATHGGEPVDMSKVDPYEILGVSRSFTWDELKSSYKRIAKLVHPDKGGSEKLFNTVTECFRILAHDYKSRQERSHNELRETSREYMKSSEYASEDARSAPPMFVNTRDDRSGNFNDRFNRAFDANKYEEDDGTSASVGYGAKMDASTKVRADFTVPKVLKKFDSQSFNKVFESVTMPTSSEVVKYREPEALPIAKSIQYNELGKSATDDFSSTTEGEGRRTLQYTDYMRAHSNTRLVDPRSVEKRKTYKNVDEYDAERSTATTKAATKEELAWMQERERKAELAERERLERLKQRDNNARLYHDRVNMLTIK
jgi:curved DNA-binding protein CbpA